MFITCLVTGHLLMTELKQHEIFAEQLDLFAINARRFDFQTTYDRARLTGISMISYLCEFENIMPGDRFYVYSKRYQDLYILISRNRSTRIRKEEIETGIEVFGRPGMISESDYMND